MSDIDIDFADRNEVLARLKHRLAKLDNGKKHNTGVCNRDPNRRWSPK